MDDSSDKKTGFMSLPREIRDQVYHYLLKTTYRVDTSPTVRYNRRLEADGKYSPQDQTTRATYKPLFVFEEPSNRLAILLVNKVIGEEAKEELYKSGTFLIKIFQENERWNWNSLGDHVRAIEYMENLEICLDVQSPTESRNGLAQCGFWILQGLLERLWWTCQEKSRGICNISVLHFAILPESVCALARAMVTLVSFKTVHFQIIVSPSRHDRAYFGPTIQKRLHHQGFEKIRELEQMLSPHLGPGIYGKDDDTCSFLKFEPRKFIESCR